MSLTDDPTTEQPDYWNADYDGLAPKRLPIMAESIGNYKRSGKFNNHIPMGKTKYKHTVARYTTGWNGMDEYIKQCQNSEKRN